MGCHTWFYKRIDHNPEYAHVQSYVAAKIKESVDLNQKWVDDPQDPEYLEMSLIYTEWTPEYIKHCLELYSRQLRMVEKGLCKEAVFYKYCSYKDYTYVPGKGFYIEADYHDLFRHYSFNDTKLFSMEETVAFITDHKNACTFEDYTERKLIEFWNKHPDGMIDFG